VIVKHGSVKMIAVRTKYITSCDLWFINWYTYPFDLECIIWLCPNKIMYA
jgi:hypothetical protein